MKQNPWWTMEKAGYGTLLVLALLLRLAALGEPPLNHDEAVRAWSAWQLIQGQTPQTWDAPATLLATAGLFAAFGSNDVLARLVPALVGTLLVLLPWWLRPLWGRNGALSGAFVLALSPLTVFFSRTLTGNALFMVTSLLFAIAVFHLRSRSSVTSGTLALTALVLLLNTGPLGIGFLLLVITYLTLDWIIQPREQATVHWLFSTRVHWRQALTGFALSIMGFIAVGSGWLTNWQGLGFPALTSWLALFEFAPGSLAWYHPLALLLAYDPATSLLGFASCVVATKGWWGSRRLVSVAVSNSPQQSGTPPFSRFIYWWLGGGTAWLMVMGTRRPEHLALILVPLGLLAGREGARLVGSLTKEDWQRVGWGVLAVCPLAVFTYLALGWFSKPEVAVQSHHWLAIGAALAGAIIALGWMLWWGRQKMVLSLAVVALAYLALFQAHSLVSANYHYTAAEWLRGPVASIHVRDVAEFARRALLGMDRPGEVLVEPALMPSLGWYLRGYKNVVWSDTPTPGTVVAVHGGRDVRELPGFARSVAGLEQRWVPASFDLEKLWRWWIYREPFGEEQHSFFTVYEKTGGR